MQSSSLSTRAKNFPLLKVFLVSTALVMQLMIHLPTLAYDGVEYESEVKVYGSMSQFSDTTNGTPIGTASDYLYYKNIIGGFSDGTFRPSQKVNRAEAAKFFTLAAKTNLNYNALSTPFRDIIISEWYGPYVLAAAEAKIINGHPNGNFRPQDGIQKAQFLAMLARAFDLPTDQASSTFTDVDSSAWYAGFTGLVDEYDLFSEDTTPTTFNPADEMSRAEFALALHRYLKTVDPLADDFVQEPELPENPYPDYSTFVKPKPAKAKKNYVKNWWNKVTGAQEYKAFLKSSKRFTSLENAKVSAEPVELARFYVKNSPSTYFKTSSLVIESSRDLENDIELYVTTNQNSNRDAQAHRQLNINHGLTAVGRLKSSDNYEFVFPETVEIKPNEQNTFIVWGIIKDLSIAEDGFALSLNKINHQAFIDDESYENFKIIHQGKSLRMNPAELVGVTGTGKRVELAEKQSNVVIKSLDIEKQGAVILGKNISFGDAVKFDVSFSDIDNLRLGMLIKNQDIQLGRTLSGPILNENGLEARYKITKDLIPSNVSSAADIKVVFYAQGANNSSDSRMQTAEYTIKKSIASQPVLSPISFAASSVNSSKRIDVIGGRKDIYVGDIKLKNTSNTSVKVDEIFMYLDNVYSLLKGDNLDTVTLTLKDESNDTIGSKIIGFGPDHMERFTGINTFFAPGESHIYKVYLDTFEEDQLATINLYAEGVLAKVDNENFQQIIYPAKVKIGQQVSVHNKDAGKVVIENRSNATDITLTSDFQNIFRVYTFARFDDVTVKKINVSTIMPQALVANLIEYQLVLPNGKISQKIVPVNGDIHFDIDPADFVIMTNVGTYFELHARVIENANIPIATSFDVVVTVDSKFATTQITKLAVVSGTANDVLLRNNTPIKIESTVQTPVWTNWMDRDNASGTGDWETLSEFRSENWGQCDEVVAVECQTVTGQPAASTGQVIQCENTGFNCQNEKQTNGAQCQDYQVRFQCLNN